MKTMHILTLTAFLLTAFSARAEDRIHVVVDTATKKNIVKFGSSNDLPIEYLWNTPYCYSTFSAADKEKTLKLLAPQTIKDIDDAHQKDIADALTENDYEQLKNFTLDYSGPLDSLKDFVENTWANCAKPQH